MNREAFKAWTSEKTRLLDGAMGTNLFLRGMPRGVNTEKWVSDHPGVAFKLQREYADAGSEIVYAPTFGANRTRLKDAGLEKQVKELNRKLVGISKDAVRGKAFVAGDMSPTGLILENAGGDAEVEDVFTVYEEQAAALYEAEVDLIVVETMMSVDELTIALDAIQSVCDLPVMCTMSVNADGRAIFGGSVYDSVETLEAMGASAVGVNCCSGPDQMLSIIENISKRVSIPVIAKPNAGMPVIDSHGIASYDMDAETFAGHMKALIGAGAGIIGGCCGTTPDYIRALRELIDEK